MALPSYLVQHDGFAQQSDGFMEWLKQNPGVRVSSGIKLADLRSENAGRGVVASHDLGDDEELFAIPLNLVLTVKNSKLVELVDLEKENLGPWLSLIVVMIYEYLRGGASCWAPYFRVLPTEFDTLMFWTDSELQGLQGSAVVDKIGKKDADAMILERVAPVVTKHPNLFPPTDGLSSFDSAEGRDVLLNLAHLMGSLIMASAFDIGMDEEQGNEEEGEDGYMTDEDEEQLPKGMVPLADLLNADADRNNAQLFQEDDFFIMKSIKPIAAGEELFNDYGDLPRADLLRRYGYVTDNYAKYDVVEIPLANLCAFTGVRHLDPGPEAPQLEFLDDAGLLEDGYAFPRFPAGAPLAEVLPKEFVIAYRALKLPPGELASLRSKDKLPKGPLSHAEAASIAELITQRLNEYSTSLEEDAGLLRDLQSEVTDASHRRRVMAIQVRHGEKEILRQLIEALNDHMAQCKIEQDNKRAGDRPATDEKPKRQKT